MITIKGEAKKSKKKCAICNGKILFPAISRFSNKVKICTPCSSIEALILGNIIKNLQEFHMRSFKVYRKIARACLRSIKYNRKLTYGVSISVKDMANGRRSGKSIGALQKKTKLNNIEEV